MSSAITASVAAITFGIAAWGGALLGETLSATYRPQKDGPAPVAVPRWPFPAAGALIGLASTLHDQDPRHLAVAGIVLFALAACTACDFRSGMLPDVCTLGPLVLLLGLAAVQRDWTTALSAAIIGIPFAATVLISHGRGMGWGDVKLAALGGAYLGGPNAVLAFAFASLAAYLVAWRTGSLRRPIAFGPYLAVSIAATGTFGRSI